MVYPLAASPRRTPWGRNPRYVDVYFCPSLNNGSRTVWALLLAYKLIDSNLMDTLFSTLPLVLDNNPVEVLKRKPPMKNSEDFALSTTFNPCIIHALLSPGCPLISLSFQHSFHLPSWNASFSVFADLLPRGDSRKPFTHETIVADLLPLFLAYYGLAVLVQLPNTRKLRLVVLPPVLVVAWRIGTQYCYPPSPADVYNANSSQFVHFTFIVALRAIELAVSKNTFQRVRFSQLPPDAPDNLVTQVKGALLNGFDLILNWRGIGWYWGRGTYVPPVDPGSTPAPSVFRHVKDAIKMAMLLDLMIHIRQTLGIAPAPGRVAHPAGTSVFDPTLPPVQREIKAIIITFVCLVSLYALMRVFFATSACVGIVLFGQDREQWPPLFQEPWRAGSVSEFWGARWHQTYKRLFVVCGAKPVSQLFGRVGGVLGAFFVSGVMHDVQLWGLGLGAEPESVTLFYVMMGVGCVLEAWWSRITGRTVKGWLGWIWMLMWSFFWGRFLVDAWTRRGFGMGPLTSDVWRPSMYMTKV
ncbi:membrane bound O-acyl transferase family-domain-containing protein [Amylostereum chailletii]|nr:membrane bound O-acyl transferase family-domain-containing protein [Amylostereum chailletii]